MAEQVEVKGESLPDLDDLLQCPVCYEIPTGQIFQCNEGHHVCGRCKARLDVCPVCRALFFGTRNYAMEELIANIRKLRAFKLVGKVTAVTSVPESSTPPKESSPEETVPETVVDEENNEVLSEGRSSAPPACKGLFRCLCCKNGNTERLAAARLLNHLRYYHSPELIEGTSENGEYLQAWQFSTVPGRIVTAVRVADMGIFFLIIEISAAEPERLIPPEIEAFAREFDLQMLPPREDTVTAWLSMAAAPWVAHEFCYTVTISGNDREAIFSDSVWSVRSCEGTLKKRGHMLIVSGQDARALTAPAALSGKLSVRRAPADQLANQPQPRAVMRVANRGNAEQPRDLEPFIQDLQNDVERLSRAFATLDREANALVRSEAEMRARIENRAIENALANEPPVPPVPLSRNARRRMRQRLRAALNEPQDNLPRPSPPTSQSPPVHHIGYITVQPANPSSSTGSTNGSNRNKKKRRQRR